MFGSLKRDDDLSLPPGMTTTKRSAAPRLDLSKRPRYTSRFATHLYASMADSRRHSCRLSGVLHDVNLEDFAATVTTSQSYVVDLPGPPTTTAELSYRFSLTDSTTPFSCVVHLTDPETRKTRILRAEIREKEAAREEYDDCIAAGGVGALVEQEGSVLSLSLGNVRNGTEIRVVFSYLLETSIQRSDLDDEGVLRMRLCLQGQQGSSSEGIVQVNLSAKIYNPGCEIVEMECVSQSHADKTTATRESETAWNLSTTEAVSQQDDFVVELKVTNYPVASWLVQECAEDLFAHMVTVLPQFGEEEREEIFSEMIIIVDRSGSMSGSRIQYAKAAMQLFMQSLDENQKIKFNIVSFGSRCTELFKGPTTLNKRSFAQAMKHIGEMGADYGGTNILQPVKMVLDRPITKNHSRQVFLLTDGEDSNTPAIIQYVARNSDTTRFFTFGIGNGINPNLINAVAKQSNGRAAFLTSNDTIETGVMLQLERALQPALTDVTVSFPEEVIDAKAANPDGMPLMFNYRRGILYFFSTKFERDARIQVGYSCGTTRKLHDLGAILIGDIVGRLAAKETITCLEMMESGGDRILELGLAFTLVTSKTSFVMTSDAEDGGDAQEGEMVSVDLSTVIVQRTTPQPQAVNWGPTTSGASASSYGGGAIGAAMGAAACASAFAPPPAIKRSVYFVGGKSVGVDWGQQGIAWDSPFKSNDMGMGAGHGRGKKNKLYDEIQKRKAERRTGGRKGRSAVPEAPDECEDLCMPSDPPLREPMPVVSAPPPPPPPEPVRRPRAAPVEDGIASSNQGVSGILLKADMQGIWTSVDDVANFIGCSASEIVDGNPKGGNRDLKYWLTVLVVATLKARFVACRVQWNLLSKKSLRNVRRDGKMELMAAAVEFVAAHGGD